jgi:hypothetical protein
MISGKHFFLFVLILSLGIFLSLPISVGEENVGVSRGKELIDQARGGVNGSKLGELQADISQRFDSLNEHVGPISRILFGVELEFSLTFVFALFFWIILFVILSQIISVAFDLNKYLNWLIGAIIASLSMYSFGDNFVNLIGSFSNSWYALGLAIATAVIIWIVYLFLRKFIFKKILFSSDIESAEKEAKVKETLERIRREELKGYKKSK